MLSLDSPRWSELRHAYGSASDMPALLRQLGGFPSSRNNEEPWYSIWSALATKVMFTLLPLLRFLTLSTPYQLHQREPQEPIFSFPRG
jgi:hypothetical protein